MCQCVHVCQLNNKHTTIESVSGEQKRSDLDSNDYQFSAVWLPADAASQFSSRTQHNVMLQRSNVWTIYTKEDRIFKSFHRFNRNLHNPFINLFLWVFLLLRINSPHKDRPKNNTRGEIADINFFDMAILGSSLGIFK